MHNRLSHISVNSFSSYILKINIVPTSNVSLLDDNTHNHLLALNGVFECTIKHTLRYMATRIRTPSDC